jgi:transcriptional accessory protein Tex/SPT6
MDSFMKMLREKARPLEINGLRIGGRAYTGLAEQYVKAINEGGVPELVTAWQGVSRAECKKALEGARNVYAEKFREDPRLMEDELNAMHKASAFAIC